LDRIYDASIIHSHVGDNHLDDFNDELALHDPWRQPDLAEHGHVF
jgi:hypothetical protein